MNRVYLSPPDLDGDEKRLILEAFDSNWITTLGPQVDAFEKDVCEKTGIPYATALSSGSAALHLALLLIGIKPGDEVLCSTFTFAATAFAITYCGATPVFIDSEPESWNLDPSLLEEELQACVKRGKIPRALIVVDLYGRLANYDPILKICAKHGVLVIEDAAEALGATYKGKSAGSFGELGVFSFNGNKIITTSGGGMLVSANKEYTERARFLATQARDAAPYYQHSHIGYNYRLSNILAAMGRGQLRNLDKKIARRKKINDIYREAFADLPGLEFAPLPTSGTPNYWLTCLTIDPSKSKITNLDIRSALDKEEIDSSRLWKPMHLQPIFESCRKAGGAFTEKLFADGLCLPSGSGMTDGTLQRIIDIVRKTYKYDSAYKICKPEEITIDSTRPTFLQFALPDIDQTEFVLVKETLESGWVTSGPKTEQFEKEFAQAVNVKHAVAVNSCTAAMHLALEAIGIDRDDEVITTPYTFAATAEVIRYFDAKPILVDVEPQYLNMNPELLNKAISKRTKAILPVHIAGMPADLDKIHSIAQEHRIPVIEDAAHAFPAKYKGKMIGSISNLTCFSFYATKTITTGEGGMICTNDESLADRCRVMSLHGISKDAWKRYTSEGTWYYEIVAPGFKYNMTDVAAAMGLAQMQKANKMLARRQEIARQYSQAFSSIPQLQVPCDNPDMQHAWHLYMLRLNIEQLRIDRDQFFIELKNRNIGSSVHFIPLHIHPYYSITYGYKPEDYPVAYREYNREISLPIYSKMSDKDVSYVIAAIVDIVRKNIR
jgi:dTDP-4-amino-4,6-dideoxygalactose transaminase